MNMSEEQEEIYQHTITHLLQKIEKRDAEIDKLRAQVKKLQTEAREEGCNGIREGVR